MPEQRNYKDARVHELIDEEFNWWRLDMIHRIFMEDEVRRICQIPINPVTQTDKLVWVGTKDDE
jgi:hypothetical protein